MHKVSSDQELNQIWTTGKGFILNDRYVVPRILHKAKCNYVRQSSAVEYPKLFFATYQKAQEWANEKFGASGWKRCGWCNPN